MQLGVELSMISEITVKIALGPPAALAEISGGYTRADDIPNPPDSFESIASTLYVPPVPDALAQSGGKFADIPAPELEETESKGGEIVPPEEFQSTLEEQASSPSISRIRIIGDIEPPE